MIPCHGLELWLLSNQFAKAVDLWTKDYFLVEQCKIQDNWCNVNVEQITEYHWWHSWTLRNQKWDQVPGGVSISGLVSHLHYECMRHTVDGLNFVGYQFSLFSWKIISTNSKTHEMVIFCIYERKYSKATKFESHECVIFVQSTKIFFFFFFFKFFIQSVFSVTSRAFSHDQSIHI